MEQKEEYDKLLDNMQELITEVEQDEKLNNFFNGGTEFSDQLSEKLTYYAAQSLSLAVARTAIYHNGYDPTDAQKVRLNVLSENLRYFASKAAQAEARMTQTAQKEQETCA